MILNTPGDIEVTNVSKHGFWLLLGDQEVFLPFEQFPLVSQDKPHSIP
jgi:hypothetical protein